MNVLVATRRTQSARANDFAFGKDGELLWRALECDRGSIDDSCGCRRSLSGVRTLKSTTTILVERRADNYRRKWIGEVADALVKGGWAAAGDADEVAAGIVAELAAIAEQFYPGAVIERRGTRFVQREVPHGPHQ